MPAFPLPIFFSLSKLISDEPQSNSSMKCTLMNYTYIQSFLAKVTSQNTNQYQVLTFRFTGEGRRGQGIATRRLLFSTQVEHQLTDFGQFSVKFKAYPFYKYIHDNQIKELPFGVLNNNLELTLKLIDSKLPLVKPQPLQVQNFTLIVTLYNP